VGILVSQSWLRGERDSISRQRERLPLADYVTRITPSWTRPDPLAPYLDILERAPHGDLREVVAAPPQHGKTTATLHAIAQWISTYPGLRHIFATYADDRAQRVANEAAPIFLRAGLRWRSAKGFWVFSNGSTVLWTALGGQITGQPCDGVFVIDDPYKDRKQANSPAYRRDLLDRMDDVVKTRLHRGASVVLQAARWHPEDLSGEMIRRGWPYTNLKAICDGIDQPALDKRKPGEPLWPARKSLDDLRKIERENAFNFSSLYQGTPKPRAGKLFRDPTYYDAGRLPDGYQIGYGIDCAYTKKTASDWSVVVRLARHQPPAPRARPGEEAPPLPDPVYYVLGVWRVQAKAPDFLRLLRARVAERRGRVWWYAAGIEKGVADFMRGGVPGLEIMNATEDKFARAQGTSASWNGGRVLWPAYDEEPDWSIIATDEIVNFSGISDPHDDVVDALVAAHDGLEKFGEGEPFDESYDDQLPNLRY